MKKKLLIFSLQSEMAIFPGDVLKFWKFQTGGGVNFWVWKIQRGGGHMTNPFRGGGMDIFWDHTFLLVDLFFPFPVSMPLAASSLENVLSF